MATNYLYLVLLHILTTVVFFSVFRNIVVSDIFIYLAYSVTGKTIQSHEQGSVPKTQKENVCIFQDYEIKLNNIYLEHICSNGSMV